VYDKHLSKKPERETEALAFSRIAQTYEDRGDRIQALDGYRHVLQNQDSAMVQEHYIARSKVR